MNRPQIWYGKPVKIKCILKQMKMTQIIRMAMVKVCT